jgi:hypothetical protein
VNPSLAVLGGSVVPVPHLLTISTARAAASLNLGKAITGMIAPAVLGMIETTTKGMLMTKLKLGAAAVLLTIGGVMGTGMATGTGRLNDSPDEPKTNVRAVPTQAGSIQSREPSKDDSLPFPQEDSSSTVLLYFHDDNNEANLAMKPVMESLLHNGYAVKSIDARRFPLTVEKYQVKSFPCYVITVNGKEYVRTEGIQSASQLAGLFNPSVLFGVTNGVINQPTPALASPPSPPSEFDGLPRPVEGPGFPVLLQFYATWAGPGQMQPVVTRLAQLGYPIKSIDIDRAPELRERYKVDSVPMFILVDGSGNVLASKPGILSAENLAKFYNENRPKSPEPEPAITEPPAVISTPGPEPELTYQPNPKPWETVVRIKVHSSEKEWGFASGTIISSSDVDAIILTAAHPFRVKKGPQPTPRGFAVPITVDLFDGQLRERSPAQVMPAQQDIVGQLVDCDFDNNVALVRIRPGKRLLASRVVPIGWSPKKGMKMITVGCSHGEDATAWDTTILDPRIAMTNSVTKKPFFEIKCAHQPKEGRSGGGLYTSDGYIAGVCNFADPNEHVGLYAVPESIHKLLDRNDLASVYAKDPDAELAKPPTTVDVDINGQKHPAPDGMIAPAGHSPLAEPALVPQPNADDVIPPPADGPGFPYLMEFYHQNSSVAAQKEHQAEIARLTTRGYPIKSFDCAIQGDGKSPGRDMANRYEVLGYTTFILVDGQGNVIARMEEHEVATAANVAAFYNKNRSKSPKIALPIDSATDSRKANSIETDGPGSSMISLPKPWQTVVRVKIQIPGQPMGYSSGVVVKTSDNQAIVLTSAHNFRLSGAHDFRRTYIPKTPEQAELFSFAKDFQGQITVDLFDGNLTSQPKSNLPPTVGTRATDIPAKLLGFSLDSDLAVIRFPTGDETGNQILAVAPLVPPGWRPQPGITLQAVGCSFGYNPTVWDTTILDPAASYSKPANGFSPALLTKLMKCAHEPKPGRAGGGLFTPEGYLVGLCLFADSTEHVGLYQTPEELRRFLDNQNVETILNEILPDVPEVQPKAQTPPAKAEEVVKTSNAEPNRESSPLPRSTEPESPKPVSDDQRRIDELEKKLDRVLQALEGLKTDKKLE